MSDERLTREELLKQIDLFIEKHDMAPTRFGLLAMGDGAFINTMRKGRDPSLGNVNKVLDFMEGYRPEKDVGETTAAAA